MRFDRKQLLLYGVTDRSWLNGQTLYEQVRKALEGAFRNTRMFLTLNGSWANTGFTKRIMTSRVIILLKQ